eukprot:568419-Prorocentrum_minimum.AAC.4
MRMPCLFATLIRLPVAGVPAVAAIVPARQPLREGGDLRGRGDLVSPLSDGVRVLVATTSGYFYEYSVVGLDSKEGEKVVCTLERESLLLENNEGEARADARWLDPNSVLTSSPLSGSAVVDLMQDPQSRSILQADR